MEFHLQRVRHAPQEEQERVVQERVRLHESHQDVPCSHRSSQLDDGQHARTCASAHASQHAMDTGSSVGSCMDADSTFHGTQGSDSCSDHCRSSIRSEVRSKSVAYHDRTASDLLPACNHRIRRHMIDMTGTIHIEPHRCSPSSCDQTGHPRRRPIRLHQWSSTIPHELGLQAGRDCPRCGREPHHPMTLPR